MKERYELDCPYFLYPAATYPHKNHLVLIEALARLAKRHPDACLVFTGPAAWKEWSTAKEMEARLDQEIRRLGIEDRVKRLGYVPGRDLDALYQEATAVTFASRFEGFGAPILEAMSRGCPVIGANATAVPEVLTDAGILCSPDNAEEWAQMMAEMIEDEEQRQRLVKAGRERAADFTWTASAGILEDAYRFVMATTL